MVVAGTDAAAKVTERLAAQLDQLRTQRERPGEEMLTVVDQNFLSWAAQGVRGLVSMPRVGVRTAARILTEVLGTEFNSALGLVRGNCPSDTTIRLLDPG